MARSPKTTTSKSRSAGKARGRTAAKSAPASKKSVSKSAASSRKASPAKTATKRKPARPQTTARKIPASKKSVAKSAILSRKASSAKTAQRRKPAKRQTERRRPEMENALLGIGASNPVSQAVAVTTEVAAGAIGAGGEIAAAAVDMVQNAAETLANVATGADRDGSPQGGSAEPKRKGRSGRKGA